MRPRKILYIITRAEHGGAQAHVLQLLVNLKDSYEVYLAVGEEGFLTREARALGIKTKIISHLVNSMTSPVNDFLAVLEIKRLINELAPDLVHAHSSKAGLLGRSVAWLSGTPSIFTAHGWAFTGGVSRRRKLITMPLERFAAGLARKIITVSRYDMELATKYHVVPKQKIITIWNGVRDSKYRTKHDNAVPKIIMVARFSKPKDQDTLLKALAGLADHNWTLEFAGDGERLGFVKGISKQLGLGDRVNFLGVKEPEEIEKLISTSDIFVLTSRWEGLPLTIIEAMRAGLPVLASNVGGVPEAVIDGRTGYLVAPGNVEELRVKLRELINSPLQRQLMGKMGRMRYEKYFTEKQMLDKTVEVYESVFKQVSNA